MFYRKKTSKKISSKIKEKKEDSEVEIIGVTHEEGTIMLLDSETEEPVNPAGGSSTADPNQGASLAEAKSASSKLQTKPESTSALSEVVDCSSPDDIKDLAVTKKASLKERSEKEAEKTLLNEGQSEVQKLFKEAKEETQSDVNITGQVVF